MLWIALHPPALSLEAFCATLPAAPQGQAIALMAAHRITAANEEALRRGVQPGLKRATALALVGDLLLGQADATRDAQALQALAHAALAFTPSVTIEGANATSTATNPTTSIDTNIITNAGHATVLLEVQSSLRYFGGLPTLLRRLRDVLAPLGHQLRIASAPTALGAATLARWRDGYAEGAHSTQLKALHSQLDSAPLWLLDPARAHGEALQGMGLHTWSDLRQLPRAGLARRFGDSLLDALDRARGERPDPRAWLVCPPTFQSRLELFARADSTAQVLHGASVLLARLVAWARAQRSRVMAFVLAMRHEHAGPPQERIPECAARRYTSEPHRRAAAPPATELRIELAVPSDDAGHLQALLRERLAGCELAAPTLELRLYCQQLAQSEAPNGELFATRLNQSEGFVRLIERLRARLGDAQVQWLQPLQDHRPEWAGRLQSAAGSEVALNVSTPPPHRPMWLLPDAQVLPERGALPLLAGRPLQLLSGPERIEAGWWDHSGPGAGLATRDYFIAQAADGALVWIYRMRLPPDVATRHEGWFLHGRFG